MAQAARRATWGPRVPAAKRVHRGRVVLRAMPVQAARRVMSVQAARKVRQVHQVQRVMWVLQAPPAHRVTSVQQGHPVHQVPRVMWVLQALPVRVVHQERMVLTAGIWMKMGFAPARTMGMEAAWSIRAMKTSTTMAPAMYLTAWAHRVILERQVRAVRRAHKVILGRPVRAVHRVRRVRLAQQARAVPRVRRVIRW